MFIFSVAIERSNFAENLARLVELYGFRLAGELLRIGPTFHILLKHVENEQAVGTPTGLEADESLLIRFTTTAHRETAFECSRTTYAEVQADNLKPGADFQIVPF
ncbi:hypothetical protein T265_03496 [Opisthorchis viverrini]|uniref:Uncharacterized protein n=1 Tax=Opisthorchis viverrini TaxID=6198 RepID=A0A074ZVV4_OPIVI|nr:hypothetical protein T265_03496 [Opisthorchis viverrini]KER30017.1 hypothetical protein T265_03496 [Opisthorchis viverrini]